METDIPLKTSSAIFVGYKLIIRYCGVKNTIEDFPNHKDNNTLNYFTITDIKSERLCYRGDDAHEVIGYYLHVA